MSPSGEAAQNSLHQAAPDEDRAFLALFNSQYRRTRDREYVRWQFFDPGAPAYLILAYDDCGRPVGCHGGHLWRVRTADRSFRVLMTVDSIARPDSSRPFLFGDLSRALLEHARQDAGEKGLAAIYCIANRDAMPVLTRLMGWTCVATLRTVTCETNPFRPARSPVFERVERFDRRDDEVRRQFGVVHPELLVIERGANELSWRFISNPVYDYHCVRAVRAGEVVGLLVLKTFSDPVTGQTYGDIVDMLWAEDDRDLLESMLRYALAYFDGRGVPTAAMWLQTNTLLDEVGRELGFSATKQERYFCCRVLRGSYGFLLESHRWFLTMADSEVY